MVFNVDMNYQMNPKFCEVSNQKIYVKGNTKPFKVNASFGVNIVKIPPKNVIPVTKFGVSGDGVHDDRIGIQRAIDFTFNHGGGTLYFPDGTYLINSYESGEGVIHLRSNVNLMGSGNASIKIGNSKPVKDQYTILGYDHESANNIFIKNLIFDGNSESNIGNSAFRRFIITKGSNIDISYCTFQNAELQQGILFNGSNKFPTSNNHVRNCLFRNLLSDKISRYDHTSVYVLSKNSSVENNVFVNNSQSALKVASAVELHATNSSFKNSLVCGYKRGGYIAAFDRENGDINNISWESNSFYVTSYSVELMCSSSKDPNIRFISNASVNNVSIKNNFIDISDFNVNLGTSKGPNCIVFMAHSDLCFNVSINNNISNADVGVIKYYESPSVSFKNNIITTKCNIKLNDLLKSCRRE